MSERVILTGASAGIGMALALEYGRRKARLVLVARRADLLNDVAERVRALGGQAVTLAVDVTEPGASERALTLANEHFGGVDTVIMNAGLGYPAFAHDFDAEGTERVMAVNYVSIVRMLAAALPRMIAGNSGRLVAVSSLAAYRGMPGSGPYNASKAAVTILMESLRSDLHGTGVSLTTIAPGFIRTDMTAKNEFRMPFMLEPEEAARRIIRAIDRRKKVYRFPWSTSLAVRLIQFIPNALYDSAMAWSRRAAARPREGKSQK